MAKFIKNQTSVYCIRNYNNGCGAKFIKNKIYKVTWDNDVPMTIVIEAEKTGYLMFHSESIYNNSLLKEYFLTESEHRKLKLKKISNVK